MAAALRGYKLVAVMADKQSKEKQDLLRAYGAEVVVCPTDVEPEDLIRYGLIPEFVGRLPVVATLEELDEDAWNVLARELMWRPEMWPEAVEAAKRAVEARPPVAVRRVSRLAARCVQASRVARRHSSGRCRSSRDSRTRTARSSRWRVTRGRWRVRSMRIWTRVACRSER